jgi:hypothetical protein
MSCRNLILAEGRRIEKGLRVGTTVTFHSYDVASCQPYQKWNLRDFSTVLELRTKSSVFAIGEDGKENEEDGADANTVLKIRAGLLIKIIINKVLC